MKTKSLPDGKRKERPGQKGATVLEVCRANGIHVPTLAITPRCPRTAAVVCASLKSKHAGSAAVVHHTSHGRVLCTTHTDRLMRVKRRFSSCFWPIRPQPSSLRTDGRLRTAGPGLRARHREGAFGRGIKLTPDDSNTMIVRDQNKCVLCDVCVRAWRAGQWSDRCGGKR